MSVIVRGMEMPTSCEECPLGDSLHCQVLPGVPALWKEYTIAVRTNRRHSHCPLVPVPPHGDLIDRDALGIRDSEKQEYEIYLREKGEDFVDYLLLEYLRGRLDGMTHASGLVRFAPTVIPADKEGEA